MDESAIELPDWLKELQRDFLQPSGELVLPDAIYARWRDTFLALPDAEKLDAAIVLIAIAAKFYRHVDKRASAAMEQLTELAALLLGSKAAATDAVEAALDGQQRAVRMVQPSSRGTTAGGLRPPAAGVGHRKRR